MTTLLLIRHGLTDAVGHRLVGRTPGVHLNQAGRLQAERLVDRLHDVRIDALYSSPLTRTLETAAPLATRRHLPIERLDGLIEIDYGDWTGRTIESLEGDETWRWFNTFRSGSRAPGGESMLEIQARMATELECIAQRHPDGTVAVFSHGDPLKMVLSHYLGLPIDFFLRFQVDPASISVLELHVWGARLRCLNYTETLPSG